MELRDYQKDLIEKVRGELRRHRRVLAVLPCRAGKTVCFAYMAERHAAKKRGACVWFLVHRKELVDQAKSTFSRMGIPTDRVLIGMVQTASRHIADLPRPTLIIFDEAHHSTAATWSRIIGAYPDVPVIGLTATPCRMDGRPLGDVYGGIAVGVSAEWLLEHGYISPYKYYAPDIRLDEAQWQTKGSDYDMESVERTVDRPEIYGDVMRYVRPGRRTIIYCPTVAYSEKLAEALSAAGIPTVHVDGNLAPDERDRRIAAFRSGKASALANCFLVGEGLDVPECDTVVMLRPTKSTALYIQQAMRCMTRFPGKTAEVYDLVGNVYRHGMPTDDREWSLARSVKARNPSGEKDVIIRECESCFRVYGGNARICPYCGHDNGLTRAQMKEHRDAELREIKELERRKARTEQGMARTIEELIKIGRERGYRNPRGWAYRVYSSRNKDI